MRSSRVLAANRSAPMLARRELGRALRGAVRASASMTSWSPRRNSLRTRRCREDQRAGRVLGRDRPGRGARGPAHHGGATPQGASEPAAARVRSGPVREHASTRRPDRPLGHDHGTTRPRLVRGRPHGRCGPRGLIESRMSVTSRYPRPRTVAIRSAPIFRRRVPTHTSTTFVPGSNVSPHTASRS